MILIWPHSLTDREDLAHPVNECGPGVAQVLALLYVVFEMPPGQVVLMDEPNSFLHPGALRRLLPILEESRQQFIITTHSPFVLSQSSLSSLHLATCVQGETNFTALNPSEGSDLARAMREVGASLADIFGADSVCWVEGRTESECFPLILRRLAPQLLSGLAMLPLVATGDVTQKKRRDLQLVLDIYERVSKSGSLMPPVVAFLLDREGRPEGEINDFNRATKSRVHLLDHRMYEDLLVNADAIAHLLQQLDTGGQAPCSPAEVAECLVEVKQANNSDHSANLIGAVCRRLSDSRVEYDKVRHGIVLTKYLLEHNPTVFSDLVKQLTSILNPRNDA